ncbi:MAG TPA: glycosyltransferase family 4 protein [Rubricoccaceae bacterium]|nr:glycosyltransferase family 4 protein [Rubricoccaceae bacterium]
MHLLVVLDSARLGGLEQAALRTLRGLQARGHTGMALSVAGEGELFPLLAEAGIPAAAVPSRGPSGLFTVPVARRRVRCMPHDALLMVGTARLISTLPFRPRDRRRQVLAVHYHHTGVKPPWAWRSYYHLALRRYHAITFPSDYIRAEAEALVPGIARVAHTVRNGIPLPPPVTEAGRRAARQALGLDPGRPTIGNAGHLIPRKRFDVFVRTLARLRRTVPDVQALIVGEGPERAALGRLAKSLGVGDAITWLGWQRDLTHFYQSLDVLLFNADWDAFPTTPQEAMSYGRPVVASVLNGGLGEILSSGEHGLLLGEHDERALAAAVESYLLDPAEAERVGEASRAQIAAHCSVEENARRYEELLVG